MTSQRLVELQRIAKEHGGVLRAEDVLEAATPEDNPLHDAFEWDDSIAGHEYRLWQARTMIRVSVTMLENVSTQPVKVFVSLKEDRKQKGGGYRTLVTVLSDEEMREALLREALEDLKVFEKKYHTLVELAPIISTIKKTTEQLTKQKISAEVSQ